jgi:glycosyltransferase involved in cell wall biosynthesis
MKVAIVSFMLDTQIGGGAAVSAVRLIDGLVERGIEVVAITTHRDAEPVVRRDERVTTYAFRPRNLYWVGDKDIQPPARRVAWQLVDFWNLDARRVVERILADERPDIVHVHKLRGLSPSVWGASKAAVGAPLVQTCRDYEAMSPEGTLVGRVGRWAEQGAWFMRPYQLSRARMSRHVDVVTAPSRFTLDTLLGRGFFPNARPLIVPNTHGRAQADIDAARVAAGGHEPGEQFRLIYVGRVEPVKGVGILCEAFVQARARNAELALDIVGDGTDLPGLRERFGREAGIHFHGARFGTEKDRLLAAADLAVVPSVWPEVFGNVIIEAYAAGKPVLTTRVGGMPELVDEGRTGFVVMPDAGALREAILAAAADPDTIRAMGGRCFTAAERYTLEAITDSYLNAYALAGASPPRVAAAPSSPTVETP